MFLFLNLCIIFQFFFLQCQNLRKIQSYEIAVLRSRSFRNHWSSSYQRIQSLEGNDRPLPTHTIVESIHVPRIAIVTLFVSCHHHQQQQQQKHDKKSTEPKPNPSQYQIDIRPENQFTHLVNIATTIVIAMSLSLCKIMLNRAFPSNSTRLP